MKKFVLALAAATMMTGSALAAQVDGVVKEFNMEGRAITLEDGKSFIVPADVALPPELAVGQKVSIQTDDDKVDDVKAVLITPN